MKSGTIFAIMVTTIIATCILCVACAQPESSTTATPTPGSVTLQLSFTYGTTPPDAAGNAYVIWLRDDSGDIQQIRVCQKVRDDIYGALLTGNKPLSGTALPYWRTRVVTPANQSALQGEVDAVSSATKAMQNFTETFTLAASIGRQFTVYVEHDQSWEKNDWFAANQPAILYAASVDLDSATTTYSFAPIGWTADEATIATGITPATSNMQFTAANIGLSEVILGTHSPEMRCITHAMDTAGATAPFGIANPLKSATMAVGGITITVQ